MKNSQKISNLKKYLDKGIFPLHPISGQQLTTAALVEQLTDVNSKTIHATLKYHGVSPALYLNATQLFEVDRILEIIENPGKPGRKPAATAKGVSI